MQAHTRTQHARRPTETETETDANVDTGTDIDADIDVDIDVDAAVAKSRGARYRQRHTQQHELCSRVPSGAADRQAEHLRAAAGSAGASACTKPMRRKKGDEQMVQKEGIG